MAFYSAIRMNRLTLDKAGRVVLPKPVRDELQLSPGDFEVIFTWNVQHFSRLRPEVASRVKTP